MRPTTLPKLETTIPTARLSFHTRARCSRLVSPARIFQFVSTLRNESHTPGSCDFKTCMRHKVVHVYLFLCVSTLIWCILKIIMNLLRFKNYTQLCFFLGLIFFSKRDDKAALSNPGFLHFIVTRVHNFLLYVVVFFILRNYWMLEWKAITFKAIIIPN